jgi:hypothetical protein
LGKKKVPKDQTVAKKKAEEEKAEMIKNAEIILIECCIS